MKAATAIVLLFLSIFCPTHAGSREPDSPQPTSAANPHFLFRGYDGIPEIDGDLEKSSFQIERIDVRQPPRWLKLGDIIPDTKFKLTAFRFKKRPNPKGGNEYDDISELTLVHTESKKRVVLIYGVRN